MAPARCRAPSATFLLYPPPGLGSAAPMRVGRMQFGFSEKALWDCDALSRSGEALIERRSSGVARLAERAKVRPAQPEVGAIARADDVVGFLSRLAAAWRAADGMTLSEEPTAMAPVRVVALSRWRWPSLIEQSLASGLGFFPRGHARRLMARRRDRHSRHLGRQRRASRTLTLGLTSPHRGLM